jgi:hypothetical protein
MKPLQTKVGPLASASANTIALAQGASLKGEIVLNGASGTFTANSIATSQSGTAGTPLTLTAQAAALGSPQYVYITSAGDDSGNLFTVRGVLPNGVPFSENVGGTNASVVGTTNLFTSVSAVIPRSDTAAAVTVGNFGPAVLDNARRVLFTSSGDDTGITLTIVGTSAGGNIISETLLGGNPTVYTKLDYKTVTQILTSGAPAGTIAVGTNTIASTPWVLFDSWAFSQIGIQVTVSGTVNYTVEQTLDDPNSPSNPVLPQNMTWLASSDTNVVAATSSQQSNYLFLPAWGRVTLNSGTGTVTATYIQAGNVPL